MKAFVVLNPVSGQNGPDETKSLLERAKTSQRWDYDLYETTGDEDLQVIVENALASGYDLVVACGGDGTVSGVVDGLANRDTPLGILPSGTANAFATEMGIPDQIPDALELLLGDHAMKAVDAIQNGNEFYLLEVSLGNFSTSFKDVSRQEKNELGWLAYLGVILHNWLGLEMVWVKVEVDGEPETFNISEMALFNTSQMGIIDEHLVEKISLDDGVLDLYAFSSKTFGDILRTLFHRLRGTLDKAPLLRYWPVRDQVRIQAAPRVHFQADGDVRGETPVTLKVAKRVVHVIIPNPE